jgi:hypothetical protein
VKIMKKVLILLLVIGVLMIGTFAVEMVEVRVEYQGECPSANNIQLFHDSH